MKIYWLVALTGWLCADDVIGLQCHEGFNASIMGLPLYHWSQRSCKEQSDCFAQKIMLQIPSTDLEVGMQYGGCISSQYSPLLTCEKLFGEGSDLDPSIVFNMLPDLDDKIQYIMDEFRENLTERFRILLSNGTGTESFISGCYTLLGNLGFNMEKALPLQPGFVKLVNLTLPSPGPYNITDWIKQLDAVIADITGALGHLDTKEATISSQIYSFLGNFMGPEDILEFHKSVFSSLVNNLPGLIKSILPKYLQVDKWYGVFFELLGDVNINKPRQSTMRVMSTMKKNMKIPEEYSGYLNPIMDSTPDLVENMASGNYYYPFHWSAKLLSQESTLTPATKRLSSALTRLYVSFFQQPLAGDMNLLVTWLPGISYNLFPGNNTDIDKIYNTIAEGIELIDFDKPNITLKKSNMSEFVNFVLLNTVLAHPELSTLHQKVNLIVINLSRVTYTLLDSRKDEMDIIFTTLLEGLAEWPVFDLGDILKRVLVNLGYHIPKPLDPLFVNLQSLIMPYVNMESRDTYLKVAQKIIQEYEELYPKSEFPSIATKFVEYYKQTYDIPKYHDCFEGQFEGDQRINWTEVETCQNERYVAFREHDRKLNVMALDIIVDLQYALINEVFTKDQKIYKNILEAFPDFSFYIRLMQVLDREDIKQLYIGYYGWSYQSDGSLSDGRYFESLVWALNGTVAKITSKLGTFTDELRRRFSPQSCVYNACSANLCNAQIKLTTTPVSTIRESSKSKEDKEDRRHQGPTVETTATDTNNITRQSDDDTTTGSTRLRPTSATSTTTGSSTAVQASNLLGILTMMVMLKNVWS